MLSSRSYRLTVEMQHLQTVFSLMKYKCVSRHANHQFFKEGKTFLYRTISSDVMSLNLGQSCIKYRRNHNVFNMSDCDKVIKKQKASEIFRLSDYDCIGFDLDNTILSYKVTNMVKLEYEVLSQYLVEEKGYSPKYLKKPFEADIDFLQKGLLIDFAHGNLLQIGIDGYVLKASHGTKFMSSKEIKDCYGSDRNWDVSREFSRNMFAAWNGPLSEKIRTLLDYFDMPSSLAFARIVDSLDDKNGKILDMYNVWPDVLAGLINMFDRDHFSSNKGGYFPALKANPDLYINKCSQTVLDWLHKIKETKKVFLITGSNSDFASLTAKHSMGDDWRNLFDIVVSYARKPGFFNGTRPFLKLEGFKETNIVKGSDLKLGGMYSQGNWQELYQLLAKETKQEHPKCLYMGDNLIQDVYTPAEFTKCDTVAIVEEMSAEGMINSVGSHMDAQLLVSKCWGSYFFNVEEKKAGNSFWDGLIRKYSKICVPNLEILASHPLDFEIKCFNNTDTEQTDVALPTGYFPNCPVSFVGLGLGPIGYKR